ncbi:UbiA family prenyltransferase [Chryseosolibacter indicus]|nr:UbiA family prenyltransferase [Chryseosolibacter indicus]
MRELVKRSSPDMAGGTRMSTTTTIEEEKKVNAGLRDYLAIARPDEWIKNIFVLPGMLFALAYYKTPIDFSLLLKIITGLASTCLVASANYVINEYLDADFDKHHPIKKKRSLVVKVANPFLVGIEYFIFASIGLSLAYLISVKFLYTAMFLLFMGIMYNVRPFRTKERVFLDVISESVNNPIRFALGWFMVIPSVGLYLDNKWDLEFWDTIPPLSIIIAYWMGGAFLMATKRFAEYRVINNPVVAGLYRKSFIYYTENKLLISMFFYAISCAFFMGIFLVKNRIEMLLSFPFFALLFAWYLKIGLLKDSPVQGYEKLYTRKWFMLYLFIFTVLICVLMFVDIPWLRWFLIKTRN